MAIRKVFVRTPYNYDAEKVSRETGLFSKGDAITQQSFKDDCDINVIVKRFRVTGTMPSGVVAPTYMTFDGVFDFHTAMNAIAVARESFSAMPADVRQRFQNDPQKFVQFCSNKDNIPEMRKMGLAIPEKMPDNPLEPDVPVKKEKGDVGNSKGGAVKGAKASAVPAGDSGEE